MVKSLSLKTEFLYHVTYKKKIIISPFSGFRYRLKGILNEKAHNLSKQRSSATSDELKKKS